MKKLLCFILVVFFLSHAIYSDQGSENNAEEKNSTPRLMVFPMLSYEFFSVDGFEYHEPRGGVNVMRFDPARGNMLMAFLSYSPRIVTEIPPGLPALYHNASLMLTGKFGRHMISGMFSGITEKPVYGGSHSFMAMSGYSYDLIEGPHFSMGLGGTLLVFDIGLKLGNGMPWMFWPLPTANLSWNYKWVKAGLGIPHGAVITIGPEYPFCLTAAADFSKLDAALWYRFFKDENPSAEIAAAGVGVKSESARVSVSDGLSYRVKYEAVYGTLRLFRFLEISGGWIFDSEEEYKKLDWTSMVDSVSYPAPSGTGGGNGHGFFVSVSMRMFS